MPISDPQLWHRLQAWRRGNGGQRLDELLRRKLRLYPKNQILVADETLRFVYLAAQSAGDASPPPLLSHVLAEFRKDQAAFASLESAMGCGLRQPDQRMDYLDPRHEALHPHYWAEFDHPPSGKVWYGPLERGTLRRGAIAFWALFAGMGVFSIGMALLSVVLTTLGALVFFGFGVYAAGLRFGGPIQAGEGDAA